MPGRNGQLAGERGHHTAQFYGDDEELTASVGRYLGDALAPGGSAVVMATEAHRLAFGAGLAMVGTNGDAAQAAGRLIVADAVEMTAGFMAGGRLDQPRFLHAARDLISRAALAGQPVRIYAEMVALLWGAGQVAAALELEELWNDLATRLPFTLLCGYPARLAAGGDRVAEQVRRLHTRVIAPYPGPPDAAANSVDDYEVVRGFPYADGSVRAARQFVVSRLGPHAGAATAIDAEIVTGELVANALMHARTPFIVAVRWSGHRVRICVRDAAPLPPAAEPPRPVPGHGLDVIAQLANRWGIHPQAGGKAIWAELSATPLLTSKLLTCMLVT